MNWSISTRLTIWYGLTMLVLLSIFGFLSYAMFHQTLHRDFDRHLHHEQRQLLPYLALDGDTPRLEGLERLRSIAFETDGVFGTYVRLLAPDGTVLYASPNFEDHGVLPAAVAGAFEEHTVSREWETRPSRSLYRPIRTDEGRPAGWLEVTGFEWSMHEELRRATEAITVGIVLSLLLSIGGGLILARRALRPVAELTDAANRIRATDLSERLPSDFATRDELTELAETFNELIARLEASFERERRFTSDAAHELLTPLTTVRNYVEVALRRDREPSAYRKALQAILTDAEEMSETVRGLLLMSRVDRLKELPTEPVDLSDLCEEYVERYAARAGQRSLRLTSDIEPRAIVLADRVHLAEVLDNLLGNATKYTPDGGKVSLTLRQLDGTARLIVSDDGIGFRPEDAHKLTGRFFRADVPAVQETTGSGLGLSIVQAIVDVYHGTLTLQSDGPGTGSTFTVNLPLAV